ncbi:glycosyltransferase family 1 protein, partial [uncultured Bradyrhizobium sp.]|uniref:glycosyltransferase family 4 protein n=1 Tax=uncultured Bradyrhizobium sp. TaxID=199684 RepID=UPI002607745E
MGTNKHRRIFWSAVGATWLKVSRPAANLLRHYAPSLRSELQPTLHALYAWLARKQQKLFTLDDFSVQELEIEPAGRKPRLLVDVSTTYHMSNVTGIQRTVRALTAALQRNSSHYAFDVLPVCLKRTPDAKLVLTAVPRFPSRDREQIMTLRPGDSFFMLDSSWDIYPKWAASLFPVVRNLGGMIFTCVYDILPITNPEYFTAETVAMFRPWMSSVMRESDVVFAISETTRSELDRYPCQHRPATEFFHLGADSLPPRSVAGVKSMAPTFLMVGTIEPRKGHSTVLRAFQILWSSDPAVRLILVGRPGWKVSTLMSEIQRLQGMNGSFFYYQNASDELLAKCYDEADAVIAASLAEGFGLPLVETMQRGKALIASDIPAFREVAGEVPLYFKAGDHLSLVEAIRSFLSADSRPTAHDVARRSGWKAASIKVREFR